MTPTHRWPSRDCQHWHGGRSHVVEVVFVLHLAERP